MKILKITFVKQQNSKIYSEILSFYKANSDGILVASSVPRIFMKSNEISFVRLESFYIRLLKFTLFALTWIFVGCDSKLNSSSSLPVATFSGAQTIKYFDYNTYIVEWNLPSKKFGAIKYNIYLKELNEVPPEGVEIAVANNRSVTAHFVSDSNLLPAETGELIGSISDESVTSFNFTRPLDNRKIYAFQVRSLNEEGKHDGNLLVLILNPVHKVDYKGCLSYTSTKNSVELAFEFPEKASKVNIYRNGQIIYTSVFPSEISFTDTGLLPATTYSYVCEAMIDQNEKWIGTQTIQAQTQNPLADYVGCIDGKPIGSGEIQLKIEIKSDVQEVLVYRNGTPIFSKKPQSTQADVNLVNEDTEEIFIDRGLQESVEYFYQCAARIGEAEVIGSKELRITTLSSNPPEFDGISSVEKLSPHSVKIKWGVTRGVPTTAFKVFYNVGKTINWQTPSQILEPGILETTIDGLGDELVYSFAVRACSIHDICDRNNVVISETLDDGGAPKASAISSITKIDSNFFIEAPWDHSHGLVAVRKVFRYTGKDQPNKLISYSDYGVGGLEFEVAKATEPQVKLNIGKLSPYQTYQFVVRDYDAKGQASDEFFVFTLEVGDLTPPNWPDGIKDLVHPQDASLLENTLIASFDGVNDLDMDSAGGTSFVIYLKELGSESVNPDKASSACNEGTVVAELAVKNYPKGKTYTHPISGLKARHFYSVCMKIKDQAGNFSETFVHRVRLTKDKSPPIFSGLQAIYIEGKKLKFAWNPSTSKDLAKYILKFWIGKNFDKAVTIPKVATVTNNLSSVVIDPQLYPILHDGGNLFGLINACDDYDKIEAGAENCTNFGDDQARLFPDLPDFTPPPNFGGISNVLRGQNEGELVVAWTNPAELSDYAGYRIYEVENDVIKSNSLGQCPCTNSDCKSSPISSCTIKLQPAKGYSLLVWAYDYANNETSDLTLPIPVIYAPDRTAPAFPVNGSGIVGTYEQQNIRNSISFQLATDNQYDKKPTSIEYKIFRREVPGKTCAQLTISDITIEDNYYLKTHQAKDTDTAWTQFYDDNALASTTAYLYRIQAIDQVGLPIAENERNKTTDTSFACIMTGDTVKPEFVGGDSCLELNSSKGCPLITRSGPEVPLWYLSWDMTDPNVGGTAKEDIVVKIYRAYSDSSTPPEVGTNFSKLNANYTFVHTGTGITRYPTTDGQYTSGPADQNIWVHYVIVIADLQNGVIANQNYATVSVYSENKVEITSIVRSTGSVDGGHLVAISGTGFTEQTKIYFGDKEDESKRCINEKLVKTTNRNDARQFDKHIFCKTPEWILSNGNIEEKVRIWAVREVGDPKLSPTNITYTFYDPNQQNSINGVCDSEAKTADVFAGGDGTEANPYIICNRSQFSNIITTINSKNYYVLEDNIDLSASAWIPLDSQNSTTINLDGKGFTIFGMNIEAKYKTSRAGLFKNLGKDSDVKNLGILNAQILINETGGGHDHLYAGFLAGFLYGPNANKIVLSNLVIQGTIKTSEPPTNADQPGLNLLGAVAGHTFASNIINSSINVEHSGFLTARCGGIVGQTAGLYAFFTQNNSINLKAQGCRYLGGVVGLVGWSFMSILDTHINVDATSAFPNTLPRFGGAFGQATLGGNTVNDVPDIYAIKNVDLHGRMDASSHNSSDMRMGSIAGSHHSSYLTIENVTSDMTLKGPYHVGGLVGLISNEGNAIYPSGELLQIINSTFSGIIDSKPGSNSWCDRIGGMIGYYFGVANKAIPKITIGNSIMSASILAPDCHRVGGMIGSYGWETHSQINATIVKTAMTGNVIGKQAVGGIIGKAHATGTNDSNPQLSIEECYIGGTIAAEDYAGGVIGAIFGHRTTIKNTLVETKFKKAEFKTGGILGQKINQTSNDTLFEIHNSYVNADMKNISASATEIGGILGGSAEPNLTNLSETYYNAELVDQTVVRVGNGSEINNMTYTKDSEFHGDENNFGASWDRNIWTWVNGKPELIFLGELLKN